MKNRWSLICPVLFVILPFTGYSQSLIVGAVLDSAKFQPLPNVNVQIKGKLYGTITDVRGNFRIQVRDTDSLMFSMVGYRSTIRSAKALKQSPVIYLREESTILKTIVIDADVLIPGLDKMEVKKPWQNPTFGYTQNHTFQGIETFGPGYVGRGLLGDVDNYETKKWKETKKNNAKGEAYASLVNSEEVKGKLMKDFSLTEDKYYTLLSKFNEKNKDIIYELPRDELTSLLFIFISQNRDK
jgi:hypothetical protein